MAKEKHFQVEKRTVPNILIVITIIELMRKYYNGVLNKSLTCSDNNK